MSGHPPRMRPRPATEPENGEIDGGGIEEPTMSEEEEDLVALSGHRSKEVEHLRKRVSYYKTQLEEAEKRFGETQQQLARLRGQKSVRESQTQSEFRSQSGLLLRKYPKQERKPPITFWKSEPSRNQPQSKPQHEIIDIKQEEDDYQPHKVTEFISKNSSCPSSSAVESDLCKGDRTQKRCHEGEAVDVQDKVAKSAYELGFCKGDKTQKRRYEAEAEAVDVQDKGAKSAGESGLCNSNSMINVEGDKSQKRRYEGEAVDVQDKGAKSAGESGLCNSNSMINVERDKTQKRAVDVQDKGAKSAGESGSCNSNRMTKVEGDKSQKRRYKGEVVDVQDKGAKKVFDKKEQRDLISMISCSPSPCTIQCQTCAIVASKHKRKLRSLVLSPTNEQLFATSALDGVVNLWQLQDRGSTANHLSATNCLSPKQRRWPEDIAWHPKRNSLFSVYTADGGESQISILNLNKQNENLQLSFLEEKPHVKGILNSIMFMPWEDNCFVTGGTDHAVVLWSEKERENSWKAKVLHKSVHTSAVMGVAGMRHKKIVMSAGADKRIIGFDLLAERVEYKHQIESKCMSVLPNPCDLNLFMIQTGTLEKQLRLFDIRASQNEVHSLGWKQESSESQSALIQQAWSPNGLYISSGSVDPVIHIFDIRYNSQKPSQSIKAHQRRVFKAVWHPTLPLLISISSDLNIGLHTTA